MKRTTKITAAMLYDLVQCPHRPAMDLFGDPAKRDEISPFVRLLWEKGTAFEHEVIDSILGSRILQPRALYPSGVRYTSDTGIRRT